MEPNNAPASTSLSEDELHALVDGHLEPQRMQVLQARLETDPEAATTLAAWQQQREALRGLHLAVASEPLPATLAAAAERAGLQQTTRDTWWRWGGMAAGLLCSFALGWFGHGQFDSDTAQRIASRHRPATAGAAEFARQASLAHLVYTPEVRHPVEVTAAQQEHLVQWLSKRLERPLKLPQLSALGYELVGGRLLPGEDGARAQFMFQNAAGVRVTLYLGAMRNGAAGGAAAATPQTGFSFAEEGAIPRFYWVEQGFGYALAGKLTRAELMALAQLVYAQAQPAQK